MAVIKEPNKNNKKICNTKKRATSYDVAKHAGVSQSLVSRCFKPGASVSQKMRERVVKSVKELGYRPNAIARGLITRRSNIVGVIISDLNSHPEVLSELSSRFRARGIHILLFTLDVASDTYDALEQVWQYQVDGVIAVAPLEKEQIELFAERGVPLVFYNRCFNNLPVSSVCCDQAEGERTLVGLLTKDKSLQSFAVVTGPKEQLVSSQRTEEAIRCLEEKKVAKIVKVEGDNSYESGRRAVIQLGKEGGQLPGAIICANDAMAIGCMDELRSNFNLSVPSDVSVVGFDGAESAAWASYNLASIRVPVGAMAKAAVSMLLDRVDNEDMPVEKRSFSGELVQGSTIRT